ncbi:MAG: TonB-dependent receptor, partial [Acidobacteriota bacterium]
TYYTHTFRLDHNLSEKHRIFGRVNVYKRDSHYNDWFKSAATGQWFQFLSRGASLDDVYSFSPTFIMNLRYGYNRFIRTYDTNPKGYGFDLTTLGLPATYNNAIDATIRRFPYITISDYSGSYNGTLWRPTETHSFTSAFDKVQGAHSLKFGMEYRAYRENQYNYDNVSTGNLDFGTTYTRGPLDNSPAAPIGQGLASMLLGLPTGGYVERRANYAEQSTVWSVYFQDDWKLTSKLSLTLGLRYEVEGPLTERFNRSIRGLDFNAALPIEAQVKANYARNPTPEVPADQFRVRGGLTFVDVGGYPRTLWERDANNFMPRIGFAYTATPKTVVRGGYGVFFGFLGTRRGDIDQTGFSQRTNLIPSLDGGLTFVATLANPFPSGIQEPLGASLGTMTYVGQGISFFNAKPLAPYMQRWQLSIQRELPHRIVLDAGYVGNRGAKIETSRALNGTPVQYLSRTGVRDQPLIDYLSTNMPNPFYPLLPGTGRAGTLIGRASLLTAYPHFTSLGTTTNEGYSWYHSFQVKADKRFSAGYTIGVAYTWSKFMEATGFLNDGDPAPAKAVSDQDYPHRLSLSWIWELPFGRGRKLLANVNPVAAAIVSGWQVQGLYAGQTGQAIGFGNVIFRGNLKDIPLPKDQRTPDRWFNIDAGFERDSARQLSYAARVMSLRFNGIRGDGINNWDVSVLKDTKINERMKAQFRAEFLNAFNHVLFSNPNTSVTSTAFGTITSEKGYPRRIQMGIKFIY